MKNTLTHKLLILGVASLLHAEAFAQKLDSTRGDQDVLAPREILDRSLERFETVTENRYSERKLDIYHDMLDALGRAPRLVSSVPAILRENEHASSSLIHALEDIGSPAAQKSLATISADSTFEHDDRLRAIMALGGVASPTGPALANLWAVASNRQDPSSVELSNTALLALGAAGSKVKAQTQLYAILTGSLLQKLRQATDASLRAMTLKAIGNLHSPFLGPQITPYLHDEMAPVRAAAAQALGMIQDYTSRELLVTLLPNEPRGAVRAAIVRSLREMPANEISLGAINDYIFVEPHPYTRASMAKYLVDHFYEFQPARGTLLDLAANDPSQQVRIVASYAMRH